MPQEKPWKSISLITSQLTCTLGEVNLTRPESTLCVVELERTWGSLTLNRRKVSLVICRSSMGDVNKGWQSYVKEDELTGILSSPHSWIGPPSRWGRQNRGSKPFPSSVSQMPKTGVRSQSTAGTSSSLPHSVKFLSFPVCWATEKTETIEISHPPHPLRRGLGFPLLNTSASEMTSHAC